jgi:hypothetical protein
VRSGASNPYIQPHPSIHISCNPRPLLTPSPTVTNRPCCTTLPQAIGHRSRQRVVKHPGRVLPGAPVTVSAREIFVSLELVIGGTRVDGCECGSLNLDIVGLVSAGGWWKVYVPSREDLSVVNWV